MFGACSRSIAWCNVSATVLTLLTQRQCLVQWVSRSSVSLMESRANGGGCKPTERCAWWSASAKRKGGRKRKRKRWSNRVHNRLLLRSSLHAYRLTLQNPAPGCWGLALALWNDHAGYMRLPVLLKWNASSIRSTNAAFSLIWSTNASRQRRRHLVHPKALFRSYENMSIIVWK